MFSWRSLFRSWLTMRSTWPRKHLPCTHTPFLSVHALSLLISAYIHTHIFPHTHLPTHTHPPSSLSHKVTPTHYSGETPWHPKLSMSLWSWWESLTSSKHSSFASMRLIIGGGGIRWNWVSGVDCFQYSTRYTGSNIRARWGLGTRLDQTVYALHNNTVILKWEL